MKSMKFTTVLVQSLADAVTRADACLEPVALRVGAAEGNFAVNRRRVENGEAQLAPNYGGIVDQRIRALRFRAAGWVNCRRALLNSVPSDRFAYRAPVVNGDYVAAARQEVERQFADQGAPVGRLPARVCGQYARARHRAGWHPLPSVHGGRDRHPRTRGWRARRPCRPGSNHGGWVSHWRGARAGVAAVAGAAR